jgi:hypothetical protein
MKRFLAVLAVVAIGAVMYVAAAPAGPQAAGPTAKQFAALKKQVATLQKQIKTVDGNLTATDFVLLHCLTHALVGVSQRGDPAGTFGYSFTASAGAVASPTTALDVVPTTGATYLLPVFTADAACQSVVGQAAGHISALTHR